MTVAGFMDLALYHPDHGYYAARVQRSGRNGDFYTSVDASSFFGEMLAVKIAELARVIEEDSRVESAEAPFDLVEAGAGNGRLMRDVLDGLQREAPAVCERARVHLVERSAAARAGHGDTLGPHAAKIVTSGSDLPPHVDGIVFANELLDALPVHVVVMRADGPREIYVDEHEGRLREREGTLSVEAVRHELDAGPSLPVNVRAEIGVAVRDWVRACGERLARGFLLLIDYGDTAAALRSRARPDGTLRAFRQHRVSGSWLDAPGEQDLTSHVDFSAVARAAAETGLELVGQVDQSRFLVALGAVERLQLAETALPVTAALRRRLAAKTLLVPGGMGSTHHVLLFRTRGRLPPPRFRKLEA